MNEDHIISAILAAGLVAQNKGVEMKPADAVALYNETLAQLIEANRPQRHFEQPPPAVAKSDD